MKVFYSIYELTPLKDANRFSTPEKKTGVLLKATLNSKTFFADYFPHVPLGDRPVEQFLSEFKYQEDEYDQTVFELLLKDEKFQKMESKKIMIHQLWSAGEEIKAPVVKYKIRHHEDYAFVPLLEKGITVRLDGNALFTRDEYKKYFREIDEKLLPKIEYIEDPLHDTNWDGLHLPCAKDFIKGTPHQYLIYKPNCERPPKTEAKVIYSPYLGGNLGTWHAYSELISSGDLNVIHGMKSDGYYREEIQFLTGNFHDGFEALTSQVKKIYQDASSRNWKDLCSI